MCINKINISYYKKIIFIYTKYSYRYRLCKYWYRLPIDTSAVSVLISVSIRITNLDRSVLINVLYFNPENSINPDYMINPG